MSDDESEVSEYDRYSLTESSEPIDALESLDREIERLNEEIARRRRQNPNGSRGAPADERAELGGVRSRLASLKKERLVVGFRQEYPAIPAEKVKLIETAKGSPDILAVSTGGRLLATQLQAPLPIISKHRCLVATVAHRMCMLPCAIRRPRVCQGG